MTNYTQELDKQIDNTREHADAIRATNPQRATYEDGFADGLGRAYRMVDAQAARIAELEATLEKIGDIAEEAQGEWSSVSILYTPEKLAPYKEIEDIAAHGDQMTAGKESAEKE